MNIEEMNKRELDTEESELDAWYDGAVKNSTRAYEDRLFDLRMERLEKIGQIQRRRAELERERELGFLESIGHPQVCYARRHNSWNTKPYPFEREMMDKGKSVSGYDDQI